MDWFVESKWIARILIEIDMLTHVVILAGEDRRICCFRESKF